MITYSLQLQPTTCIQLVDTLQTIGTCNKSQTRTAIGHKFSHFVVQSEICRE